MGLAKGLCLARLGFACASLGARIWGAHGTLMSLTWFQTQLARGVRGARVALAWGSHGAAMGPVLEDSILCVLGPCVGGVRLVLVLCEIRKGLIWDSHGLRM